MIGKAAAVRDIAQRQRKIRKEGTRVSHALSPNELSDGHPVRSLKPACEQNWMHAGLARDVADADLLERTLTNVVLGAAQPGGRAREPVDIQPRRCGNQSSDHRGDDRTAGSLIRDPAKRQHYWSRGWFKDSGLWAKFGFTLLDERHPRRAERHREARPASRSPPARVAGSRRMEFDGTGQAFDVPIPDTLIAGAGDANAEMWCFVEVTRNHLTFGMHRLAEKEVFGVHRESNTPEEFSGR